MLVSMVNIGGLVDLETVKPCFEAGFTVSDFSFRVIDRLDSTNPTSNPTFGFLIDRALSTLIYVEILEYNFYIYYVLVIVAFRCC